MKAMRFRSFVPCNTSVIGVIERFGHPISPCRQECALLDPHMGAALAIDWVIKRGAGMSVCNFPCPREW